MTWVKVCGIRDDAGLQACLDAKVDAIGINLWPESPRYCPLAAALELGAAAVASDLELCFVLVNAATETLARLRHALPTAWLQFHGDEDARCLATWFPRAYRALPLATEAHLAAVAQMPGRRLLVDAAAGAARGGTGLQANWDLAAQLSPGRDLILAGGLCPDNVADAVAKVRPFGVDTASGVESAPGRKDAARIADFVAAAKRA